MSDPSGAEQLLKLKDAMWQLLDDMGINGLHVCLAAKAQARIAYEPFRDDESPLDWPVDEAKRILAESERGEPPYSPERTMSDPSDRDMSDWDDILVEIDRLTQENKRLKARILETPK